MDSNIVGVIGAKGGVGTTTTTILLALAHHKRLNEESFGTPRRVYIVDCCGDVAAALGQSAAPWGERVEVKPGLVVVPLASLGTNEVERHGRLRTLTAFGAPVFVDCGAITDARTDAQVIWNDIATERVAVMRNDYLGLRSWVQRTHAPFHVGLCVVEPNRALSMTDVRQVVGGVVYEVAHLDGLARAVDAGVLATRVPSQVHRWDSAVLDSLALTPAR